MKEQLEVTDLKGNKIGVMNVSLVLNFYLYNGINSYISLID